MNLVSGPSHIGDVFWTLIALRRIPGPHTIFCPPEYHANLDECREGRDITFDVPENAPAGTPSSWIGSQRFSNKGVTWGNQPDIIGFLMRWNNCLCEEAGISPQFKKRSDLLAEFPAIARRYGPEFDVLVCNCHAGSGQTPRLNFDEFDGLIEELGNKYRVLCTNETRAENVTKIDATVCQIGNLALRAKFVVAVGSGCHWGIHSVWSQYTRKFLFLEPQTLNYGGEPMPCHGLVSGMRQELQSVGWL